MFCCRLLKLQGCTKLKQHTVHKKHRLGGKFLVVAPWGINLILVLILLLIVLSLFSELCGLFQQLKDQTV